MRNPFEGFKWQLVHRLDLRRNHVTGEPLAALTLRSPGLEKIVRHPASVTTSATLQVQSLASTAEVLCLVEGAPNEPYSYMEKSRCRSRTGFSRCIHMLDQWQSRHGFSADCRCRSRRSLPRGSRGIC